MKKKKLSKQQVWENQKNEDKKFNRNLIVYFSTLIVALFSVLTFYTYGCETRYLYHKWAWYGKEIPAEWVCMNSDKIQLHKTLNATYNNRTYYFCSQNCFNHMVRHFTKVAMVPDAFSGDSIYKSDALIGLKAKGEPELVYFKNTKTLSRYYAAGK
jgi:hypothetical protein